MIVIIQTMCWLIAIAIPSLVILALAWNPQDPALAPARAINRRRGRQRK